MRIGCVIMASGQGKRFGSNKLMADFQGKPMVLRILESIKRSGMDAAVAVTRHPEVAALCEREEIPAVLHTLPSRSDTVRLGVDTLRKVCPDLDGILFAAADQPCLRWESITALKEAFAQKPQYIYRLCWGETMGNPVLFPKDFFEELRHLPEGKGGSAVLRAHPEAVRGVEAVEPAELMDVDTPEDLRQLERTFA